MDATKEEKVLYGSQVEIMNRGDNCTIYRLSDQEGEVVMTSYAVFPGIRLIYNDVHARRCATDVSRPMGNVIEIEHCREGRGECQMGDQFFYLAPGDISVHGKDDVGLEMLFPQNHYHGITVMLDVEQAPRCLSCILDGVDVRPEALAEKFCTSRNLFVLRKSPSLEHIFSELYTVPERIRVGYFKVKVMELLLFLSGLSTQDAQKPQGYSASQVQLAKRVAEYLLRHMNRHITITCLSEHFGVSETQLKASFRGVYGVSVYTYIREQKMLPAARMLRQTKLRVIEIAGHHGYDNGSKFAKAFRDVLGVSPREYRMGSANSPD